MMSVENAAPSRMHTWKKLLHKCLVVALVFSLLVQVAPLQAFAAWDGSGSTSGDGASQIVGDFSALGRYGYRFSAYTNT